MTPRPTKRDQTIPLGVVGRGSVWETRFRAALQAITRGKVTAVYSPQPEEARSVALETGATAYSSLRRMLADSGVKALLLLEPGWTRDWSITLAAARQIPALVALPIDDDLSRVVGTLTDQEAEGAVVVPGTTLRATPASLRLRELIATKLGPVCEVRIELPPPGLADAQVIAVIDWCRWLLGSAVSQIVRHTTESGPQFVMNFGRRQPNSTPVRTLICCHAGTEPLLAHIQCQSGVAQLTGESSIRWQTDEESAEESLESDRPAEQVLLDLFLRRVVGGVVPVPSWADLHAACQLWLNARESA